MRITLSLDDQVVREVKAYAKTRHLSVGKAISNLVWRGLRASLPTRIVNGFHVVDLPPGSPSVSSEHVTKLLNEIK
jgi:hypothetical protein